MPATNVPVVIQSDSIRNLFEFGLRRVETDSARLILIQPYHVGAVKKVYIMRHNTYFFRTTLLRDSPRKRRPPEDPDLLSAKENSIPAQKLEELKTTACARTDKEICIGRKPNLR